MTITTISQENLSKDKNVLGKEWKNTYKGFFGDEKNIDLFVNATLPLIPKKKQIKILYAASASGMLGEALTTALKAKGVFAELTIIDISQKHLDENINPNTRKICGDLLTTKLEEEFEVIIMRSSLDYIPTKELQIQLLKNINNWLEKEGIFVNQVAALPTKLERDCADEIYKSNDKIGKRHFQCDEDIYEIYKTAGFRAEKISDGTELLLTEEEHKKRYQITQQEVFKIQEIIRKIKSNNIITTENGYLIKFIFPIYSAQKN